MIRKLFSIALLAVGLSVAAQNDGAGRIAGSVWHSRSISEPLVDTAAKWKGLKAPVTLFVGSDLGRNGYYEQKPIAALMGAMAETIGPDAVLALGDTHHYQGVQSIYDPLWQSNYESIYNHPELMVDWNAVCGNHEYRGNTQAVIDYSKISRRWDMPARYYTKTYTGKGVSVKVIFIDTTPIISKYHEKTEKYPDVAAQDVEAQLAWLDRELANATEDWVIVAGHHPVYADTPKDDSERSDMRTKVGSILNRHKPDMYIGGHIHNFQHISHNGIDYIVNSSGSQSRPEVNRIDGTVFVSGKPGFSVVSADKASLRLSMIDNEGNIIHQVTRNK